MPKRKPVSQSTLYDQIKKSTIKGLFGSDALMNELVLKEGNAIGLVYGISTRASFDLDFSLPAELPIPLEEVRDQLKESLAAEHGELGFEILDFKMVEVPDFITPDLKSFWGGYKIEFKLIESGKLSSNLASRDLLMATQTVGEGNRRRFSIDISKHEYCNGKRTHLLDGLTIYVYSPEMIVAEKLRAICQQMPEYTTTVKKHRGHRARDFVDIFMVANQYSIVANSAFCDLIRGVFAAKRVPLELLQFIEREREYHRTDFQSVLDTISGVTPLTFDQYVDFVVSFAMQLESMWNE